MKTLLEQIRNMKYVDSFVNAWGERNDFYVDSETGVCYDVVTIVGIDVVDLICTVDPEDDELMPIEILFHR